MDLDGKWSFVLGGSMTQVLGKLMFMMRTIMFECGLLADQVRHRFWHVGV